MNVSIGRNKALLLLGVIFAGIYTALPLPITGALYIPFVILFAATGYFLLFHFFDLDSMDLGLLCAVALLLILNILFSATPINFIGDKVKAFLQIFAGITLGIFTAKAVHSVSQETLSRFILGTVLLIYALVALERLGIIDDLSNSWRSFAYTGVFTNPYANDARDINMVQFIRPKAFTAEPAFLAGFIFIALNALALCCKHLSLAFASLFLSVAGFFLIGSPILVLALFSVLLTVLYRFPRSMLYLGLFGMLAGAFVFVNPKSAFPGRSFEGLADRFANLSQGEFDRIEDDSVRSRLIVPFTQAVPTSASMNPFFGIGIGGKEYLSRKLDENYSSRGNEVGKYELSLGTNALGNLIVTMGLGGFSALLIIFAMYLLKRYGYFCPTFLPAMILFTFTRGAYETQSFWSAIFLFVACAYAGAETPDEVRVNEDETISKTQYQTI